MRRLEDRTVIVTGGAQGMGAAVARRCRDEGANLVLVDREPVVEDVARSVDGVAFVGDVTSAGLAEEVVAAVDGPLWGLANVAGVHHAGDLASTDDEDWERLFSINLTAPRTWARAIVPRLLSNGGGSIVIVTSINGSFARPNSLAYTASKTGALGLMRSLAVDYGRQGVRTNSISPGSVETPMLLDLMERHPHVRGEQLERTYSPRIGLPEDIAAGCAYLLSDDAAYVNGADLRIDGGRTAAI
jgi:NAD(P)-dependent dehydrogenase (short-subunit alcohol dehydrogenase family)